MGRIEIMTRQQYLLLGLIGALFVWGYTKRDTVAAAANEGVEMAKDLVTPRGIRNNNPGNIRHGQPWQGLAAQQPDASFATFISPEYGIRAISKIIDTYANRYGINTVRGIINKWAPPSENDTDAYVDAVADAVGVRPDQVISVGNVKTQLIAAIIQHENGQQPYSAATISGGVRLA